MAGKEERILHIVQKLDGRFVGENRITRQEAIERMAYAMLKADDPEAANEWLQLQWNSIRIIKHYMVMAEATLNALLGESNDLL